MKASDVRSNFLDFFAERGHERVASSSLVPANDPTLLFTNAGMVQFKDVFTGHETRSIPRATSSQKCVRAGGKHNDLDEVGKTARHHTFFEMLGNFSFGDYFKEDAIAWAWELLTEVYGLDKNRLVLTVFGGDDELGVGADDEARAIWKRVTGFGDDRVVNLGMKENFWMMGETGPMGPCSEIHYAIDPELAKNLPTSDSPEAVWDQWLEVWNLVFMQYERREKNGELHPLPAPSIDTGAGLERVTSVLQGVDSNYHTDLFMPLLELAAELSGKKYGADETSDTSMRVIADHARCSAFLIADGVFPDKTRREYVLRRIFRRAVRHGKLLDINEPFMHRVCDRVIEEMSPVFPELSERRETILQTALEEEKRFRRTLERGLGLLEEEFERMDAAGEKEVPGGKVFQLYDTFGFPDDLTEIIAEERGYGIDKKGYEEALDEAKKLSSFNAGDAAVDDIYKQIAGDIGATEFLGYQTGSARGKVVALVVDGARVDRADSGSEVGIVVDRTPFYAESGGQIGDTGTAKGPSGSVAISDCKKPTGDMFVHLGKVTDGAIAVGDELELQIDEERRNRIRANHSATHLLHLGLKKILGEHVAQKGSLVAPDRLRFDFSHFAQVSDEEKRQIEDFVNREILANRDSVTEVLPFDEAKERGAVAMFGEKYGEKVRVVQIGGESLEFCGGTHVARSGDIGLCKIIGESSVAQGVRRLEAVTGLGAMDYLRKIEDELGDTAMKVKAGPFEVAERVGKMQAEQKKLEKEIAELKAKLAAGGGARDLMSAVVEKGGVKILATSTGVADAKVLRETGDKLRDKLGSGVVVLAGVDGDKVSLLAMVTKDLAGRFHAGKLLKSVAEIVGGRGGGRPDMAQGGGNDPSKVPQALDKAVQMVAEIAENAD